MLSRKGSDLGDLLLDERAALRVNVSSNLLKFQSFKYRYLEIFYYSIICNSTSIPLKHEDDTVFATVLLHKRPLSRGCCVSMTPFTIVVN